MNLIGTKTLETDRLILRRLTIDDAESAYKNWCSSDIVSRYVLWEKHKNVEETKELFKMWEEDYNNLDTFRWIVELKDTKEVIGTIDVCNKKFLKFSTCEIGYCYGEAFWNKGYGTEALKRVLKFLFEEVGLESIYAYHASNNPASGKVMKKSGMTYEGTLRSRIIDKEGLRNDLISYSMIKEDYFNRK